ncbi:MAG: hypothetical protein E6G87_03335 [Alphaproteobacteria bacterium]|nr:MAG: hypothetical protein E6G87_03335 [Alphaproteobacteria bacterium]
MRLHAAGGRKLARRLHGFEHLDRLAACLFGRSILAAADQRPCQCGKILAFLQAIASLPPEFDRLAARPDRFGEVIDDGALFGVIFQQLRANGGSAIGGESQCAPILRRGYAMSANGRRRLRRRRSEFKDGCLIIGAFGEMRQLCEIVAAGPA